MRAPVLLMVLALLLVSTAAQAAVPGMISYQGTLTDDGGVVLDTTVAMTFTIYYDSTGAGYIWTETQPSVVVTDGIFNVLLGSVNPLSEGLFGGSPSRWLGVQVGGDPELTPRQRIVTVAHAFHAAEAETANYAHSAPAIADGDWTIIGSHMYSAVSGNVGIGRNTPNAKLDCPGPVRIGETNFNPTSSVGLVLCANDNTWSSIPLAIVNTDTDYLMYVRGNGDVGIGTWNPSAKLDVLGTAKMTGFTMPTGATGGHVLTSDASGNGTWQAGFTGLWSDAGSSIYPNNASNFAVYDNSSSWVGLSFVSGTETNAITNWSNDGSYALHCHNSGSSLCGINVSATSPLTDYGILSSGEEYGGYFDCGTGGTAVYGEYDTDTYGYLGNSSCGAYGQWESGTYGYMGYSGYGVWGHHTDGNYGFIGSAYYGVYGNLETTDAGSYAIYGYGTDSSGEDGTAYGVFNTLGGVKGYNYYGNPYTFGVAGYSYLDYNRSGGCLGAYYNGSWWGSLGYKNSGGTNYGGYFTNYTSGTGKNVETALGIGLGSWGDLFGADIHGKVYGAYVEGGNYALYSNGDLFRNGMDVHLQENGSSSMAVLYTNVSTDVTVQTSGFATLSGGRSIIAFDEHFRSVISDEVPIVVTVTPTGDCNGVHVSEVTRDGFTVVENNAGKSSVQVAFIAVGRRAGYEDPQLPAEVVSSDYVQKLSRGLHNDADTQNDAEGLYFENGELVVGMHPSTLPDPNKPAEELEQLKHTPPVDVPPVRPAEVKMRPPSQDNRASEQIRTRQSD